MSNIKIITNKKHNISMINSNYSLNNKLNLNDVDIKIYNNKELFEIIEQINAGGSNLLFNNIKYNFQDLIYFLNKIYNNIGEISYKFTIYIEIIADKLNYCIENKDFYKELMYYIRFKNNAEIKIADFNALMSLIDILSDDYHNLFNCMQITNKNFFPENDYHYSKLLLTIINSTNKKNFTTEVSALNLDHTHLQYLGINPLQAWRLFIDRDKEFTSTSRQFGPLMFEKALNFDDGNFLQPMFNALGYVMSRYFNIFDFNCFSNLSLYYTQYNEIIFFITVEKLQAFNLKLNKVGKDFIQSGSSYISEMYYSSYTLQDTISNDDTILTKQHEKELSEFLGHNKARFIDNKRVSVNYTDIDEIKKIYNNFCFILKQGLLNKDNYNKLSAILLFVSKIELSHFFINCNTRISLLLLNKLLRENGFDFCALVIPNGFFTFVAAEFIKTKRLDRSIWLVQEGIEYYKNNIAL